MNKNVRVCASGQGRIQRGGGGLGDLSLLNFLEVKIIKNVKNIRKLMGKKNPISVEIFPRDPNGDAYFSFKFEGGSGR